MLRYAVYFAPRRGAFADHASRWLGRDAATSNVPGLSVPAASITAGPRRYGFHGTIRAPFRPASGLNAGKIAAEVANIAARLRPAICDGLQLKDMEGFLALTPEGSDAALLDTAAAVVKATNALRAPLTEAEIARRCPERLTPHQRDLLNEWGYPFVMEEFRFHLTLTDRLPPGQRLETMAALQAYFQPVLPRPFAIEDLCLFGEDAEGRFHLLHRYALTG